MLIANITSEILDVINPKFELAIISNLLILISYNSNHIEEFNIELLDKPNKIKGYPTESLNFI